MVREPESPRYVLILGGLFLIVYASYQVGLALMGLLPPGDPLSEGSQPYPIPESGLIQFTPYPPPELANTPAYPYPDVDVTAFPAYPYPGIDDPDMPTQPYPGIEVTVTPAEPYPEIEITDSPASPTLTLSPTPTLVPALGGTPTQTPTPLPTETAPDAAYPGPEQSPTPGDDPYPGPESTATPGNDPYPGPDASPTSVDDPYPGPEQTATSVPPTPTDTSEQPTYTPTPTVDALPTLESTPAPITSLTFTEIPILSNGSVNQAIWLDSESDLGLATSKGLYLFQPLGDEPRILDAGSPMASIARITGQDKIAVGGYDSLIRMWGASDGSFVEYFSGHLLGVVRLSFSPNGSFLASASDDATVRIWDITGDPLHILRGPITRVVDMAVSPNGQMVAAASNQNVHIWNQQTGELIHTISQPAGWFTALTFNPNSQILVTAYDGKKLEFWDTTTWEQIDFVPLDAPVQSLAYRPTGFMLAIAFDNGRIHIRNTYYNFLLADLAGHPNITNIVFSPYNDQLLTSSADGFIRLWDITRLVTP